MVNFFGDNQYEMFQQEARWSILLEITNMKSFNRGQVVNFVEENQNMTSFNK